MGGPEASSPRDPGPAARRAALLGFVVVLLIVPPLTLHGAEAPAAAPSPWAGRAPVPPAQNPPSSDPLSRPSTSGLPVPGSLAANTPTPRSTPVAFATIDLVANRVTGSVVAPRYVNGPGGIAYDSTDHLVFVSGLRSFAVEAIDPASGIVQSIGRPLVVGNNTAPEGQSAFVAFNSADNQVYVTDPVLDQVDVYQAGPSVSVFRYNTTVQLPNGSHPEGIVAVPSVNRVFVADYANDTISVINGTSHRIDASVAITGNPYAMAYDPVQNLVYVTQTGLAQVAWFDPVSFGSPGSGFFQVKNAPFLLAYDPQSASIWVGNPQIITVINATTRGTSFNITFPVGTSLQGLTWDGAARRMVASNVPAGFLSLVSENGSVFATIQTGGLPALAVTEAFLGETDVLDLVGNVLLRIPDVTQTVTARVALGNAPAGSTFNPVNDRIEVADNASNRIIEFDARKTTAGDSPVTRRLTVPGQPAAVGFDPDGGLLVVASNPGLIVALNASSGAVVRTVNVGSSNLLYDVVYGDAQVFVSGGPNDVWAFDAKSFALLATIHATNLFVGPRLMAFDPSHHHLYLALSGRRTVGIIDTKTDLFLGEWAVGTNPYGLAYDNPRGVLLVSMPYADSVSAVNVTNGTTVHRTPVGSLPGRMVYIPAAGRIFVSSTRSNEIDVLQADSFLVSSAVAVGDHPSGLAYSNVTGALFASDGPDGSLVAIGVAPASAPPFHASVSAAPSTTDVGAALTLTVTASYPPWAFSYSYSGLPPGCTSSNVSSYVCSPSAAGANDSVAVSVVNQGGDIATALAVFTIVPDPSVTRFDPVPPTLTLQTRTTFHVVVSDGLAPYRYVYTSLPPGCTPSSTALLVCQPNQIGTFTAQVTVIDSVNIAAFGTTNVTVNSIPALSVQLSPNSTKLGGNVTISARETGGTAPYAYNYSGLPSGCLSRNSSDLACTPTAAGTFSIRVVVTDASGFILRRTVSLEVVAPAPASSGLPIWLLGLVGTVAIVGVLGALLALRRRRPGASADAGETAAGVEEVPLYGGEPSGIEAEEVVPVAPRGPVAEPSRATPRYYRPGPGEEGAPAKGPGPGPSGARPALTCKVCGTVNEAWLTHCRWCKRPLQST